MSRKIALCDTEWVEKMGKCLGINSRRLLSNGWGGGREKKKDMEIKGIEEEIKRRVLSYFQQKIAFNFSS